MLLYSFDKERIEMQNTYTWKVIPSSRPTVIRSCPKCQNHAEYACSGNFRVNANQNNLDVWLIYQCSKCKSTWNMEILSRTNSKVIDRVQYQQFLQNDAELADRYAFDPATHSRNRTTLNYENVSYDIEGASIDYSELRTSCRIELISNYPLDLRMDKILSRQLGISRETIKTMGKSG
jgi:hypothetical protein